MSSPAPLFVAWETLTAEVFRRTAAFPRSVRSSLTRRIEDVSLEILESLATAHYSSGPRRIRLLEAVDERLVRFRLLIRLAHTLRFLDTGAYEHVCRQTDEVGRRLGAWLSERRRGLGAESEPISP